MKLNGSQILCESLIKEGVEVMFGFPGGVLLPFYEFLPDYPQIRHILVRHEQAAAHAADGYARATGKVGVCMATSGPGATNLVTGIANAYLDSTPMVALTGQVATPFIGKDSFQEVDITGITLPITKHNYLVTKVDDLATVIKEAFHIASTGRPGPVLIDIPKDVLQTETTFHYPDKVSLKGYKPTLHGHVGQIKKAAKMIAAAQRPLILAGHGIILARAYDELRELAEKCQIPVATTLLGIGSFPTSHVLNVGMLGMHGMAWANFAVSHCDLIVAIGMRLDDRATGKVSSFAPYAQVVHIDIDPAELGKNIRVDVPIVGDVRNVLQTLNQELASQVRPGWLTEIQEYENKHPMPSVPPDPEKILPQQVVRSIYEATQGDATIVTGVGQHQMWAAQHFIYDKPNSLISSGGLGTMGFGLPAAMGVKVAKPEETVWVLDGDGSFQMNIQELATLVQDNIGVKIAIINNGFLGMIRQWQQLFHRKRYSGSVLSAPDFAKVAEAYGIPAMTVERPDQVDHAISWAMSQSGPVLLNFIVEPEENVLPMVAPGAALMDMIEAPKKRVKA
ncbi:MAG: biosynthetic-type acetolactate synthase large subunit [Chloroflexota bacterium]|nr:MAG: biosynthetic-type acetolactate synthase large subunit [Chloroflexota bacterium]